MAGRLLDSRLAFLAAAPIAIPLGYAAAMWPLYALAGVGVFAPAAARGRAGRGAAARRSRPSLPWEGALAYPTESVSVVKILGVLLFGAWLLRALVRSEPLRVSPALGWAAFFGLAVGLSLLFAPDPADSVFDSLRYALFIVFFFLVLQLTHTIAGRAAGRARGRPLDHGRRRVGHLRVRHAPPRARRRADRGPERLRLPDELHAPPGRLSPDRGEAPPDAVGVLLHTAARRDAGHAFARRPGRARGAGSLGHHHAPRAR